MTLPGTEVSTTASARYEPHVSSAPEPSRQDSPAWPAWQRFLLRFVFAYFVVLLFPGPLQIIPGVGSLLEPLSNAEVALTVWVGRDVLGITAPMPNQPTGSGDTMLAWVRLVHVLAISLIVAALWLWADVRGARRNDARVQQWMNVYLRFTLAFILFGYGFAKIFQSQFPPVGPERLVETLGEMSPMGLLWTFMGFSRPYNLFTGLAETIGPLLLCFGRTATLGALLSTAVMANIVALNFMFDVPVKQYSAHLLIMALIIAAPDLRRLANVLVLQRPAEPRVEPPLFATRRVRLIATGVTAVAVLWQIWQTASFTYSNQELMAAAPRTAAFYGVYDIEEIQRNGRAVPLLVTNSNEWRRIVFSAYRNPIVHVRTMGDSAIRFSMTIDSAKQTLTFVGRPGFMNTLTFGYERLPNDRLRLAGRVANDSVVMRLVKSDKRYQLTSRGYHWVQELPFNR